ncbi:MAG: hypothetical protein L0220_21420 [Acidobacteria bacterium]|nr:hypothetical protein [Acidobacteriota bacterium]
MKLSGITLKIFLVWLTLIVAFELAEMIFPGADATSYWILVSHLLVAIVLVFLAMRSDWQGWRLALALSVFPFVTGIAGVANNIEAVIFLTTTGLSWKWAIGYPLLASTLAFPLLLLISGWRSESLPVIQAVNYRPFQSRQWGQRVWRYALSSLAYTFLYFLAGMIILPIVIDFYKTQTIPPVGKIFLLQLLVRGPVYVALCLLLTRMLGLSRIRGAIAVGGTFATLNGIVPLLIPNEVFPEHVRWAHFGEVVGSNFVFGFFVGWLWGKRAPASDVRLVSKTAHLI